jgi:hypothetical protein
VKKTISQFGNAAMRQTLREALGIGQWALPACAVTPSVSAQAGNARPRFLHCRIAALPHWQIANQSFGY